RAAPGRARRAPDDPPRRPRGPGVRAPLAARARDPLRRPDAEHLLLQLQRPPARARQADPPRRPGGLRRPVGLLRRRRPPRRAARRLAGGEGRHGAGVPRLRRDRRRLARASARATSHAARPFYLGLTSSGQNETHEAPNRCRPRRGRAPRAERGAAPRPIGSRPPRIACRVPPRAEDGEGRGGRQGRRDDIRLSPRPGQDTGRRADLADALRAHRRAGDRAGLARRADHARRPGGLARGAAEGDARPDRPQRKRTRGHRPGVQALMSTAPPVETEAGAAATSFGPTILLVEDERSIGTLVRGYLERAGYRLIWVR